MTSGTQTLNSFADKRAVLERQARSHADAIHTHERRMQTIVQTQGELWKRMAAIHINANLELPAGVRKSMDGRHDKIEVKKVEVERIKTNLSALKRMRTAAAEQRSNLAQGLERDHAVIATKFEADPRIVDLRRRIAGMAQAFAEADEKKQRAATELAEKRVAYESDELFGYLRRRGYGTPSYTALLPLTRHLDRALAKATNFDEEKANYDLLVAVPDWVDERIAALAPGRKKADAEFAEIEREFFGELGEQKKALASKDEELHDIDRSIEGENNAIAVANKFLSDAALAEDSELKRIVADFSAILSKKGFYDLKRLAAETKDPEDDRIVAELQDLMRELADLTKAVEQEKTELFVLERKVKSFEQVESHLRSNRWNSRDHTFNGVNADQLSNQLSTDSFSAAVVIGMLSNAHEEPRRHEYGSSYGGSSNGSSSSSTSDYSRTDNTPTFSTSDSYGGGSDTYTTTDSY
ncbi:hypothetical protein HFO56_33265 [Rhizobium laguerreae]|uniref:hypothetical protein n=1 Tax=Rhizobium laguerreae TaxID=1076926 RepID=UPI001C9022A5|nr:hypothetical protein [Rhizobium laguerreae]MBY3157196.1 hypothetical protein [Rhizobium laguerreae]